MGTFHAETRWEKSILFKRVEKNFKNADMIPAPSMLDGAHLFLGISNGNSIPSIRQFSPFLSNVSKVLSFCKPFPSLHGRFYSCQIRLHSKLYTVSPVSKSLSLYVMKYPLWIKEFNLIESIQKCCKCASFCRF
ncbi:hypothetical protein CEXT_607711 [Caerostris extrusa]|uniref:Uncharacterized protein n=1 Tax=Caerostris extrusa TaxID=172846 RepID=A0AAV4XCN6_CAEEX|nr:hypothetical protein CEXT_607711 [Caerostris extrusa]